MNSPERAKGGRFKNVDYFDGGLFSRIDPIDLKPDEIHLLSEASQEDWSKVQPPIFGSLFEGSMGKTDRHALGAHFTYEADIKKIVRPTIEKPWKERIEQAETFKELTELRDEINQFKVLDPACGCGNFLYVAFMELRRLEMLILQKIHDNFATRTRHKVGISSRIRLQQFYGIDINSFAVELAKVTLMLAKEQSIKETQDIISQGNYDQEIGFDKALPLDNLDGNIIHDDALFCDWPKVDAIIGNPPYQSKNKMQKELGPAYLTRVRTKYPQVPGRADYCVYWFRRAHDELLLNKRAGLVGTNTIRQNYSREGGLDYVVGNNGTIIEAISSQPWSGDAAVHVSIVNWVKGAYPNRKILIEEIGTRGNAEINKYELDTINSSLSNTIDLKTAKKLTTNAQAEACYQGQTHGHEGFLLSEDQAQIYLLKFSENKSVLFPYLAADEMLSEKPPIPKRYVIDFHPCDILTAARFKDLFQRIREIVLPDREISAAQEKSRNSEALRDNPDSRLNNHHTNFLKKWWLLSYPRGEMIKRINKISRYVACSRVTKRPIFEFISSEIRPNDSLQVFTVEDDYSFGILQSIFHWMWLKEKCSTLTERYRYTSDTVFDTFPWPQTPKENNVKKIAEAAVNLRQFRHKILKQNNWSLRDLYRTLDTPGTNPLSEMHFDLDAAVRETYGMEKNDNPLQFLLTLNCKLANDESNGKKIIGPGLPAIISNPSEFITEDCIEKAM
jgi:hypothetical protein